MEMTGEQRIAAPRDKVWAALNDPEILRQAIPGCDGVEKESETQFVAKVTAKVGPVSARFSGKVTLSDLDPPKGYTISGEGQGGVAGFARGSAKVELVEDGSATVLKYAVTASVGGKLAQIGSRLIDATAAKMAEQFFSRFEDLVAGAAAEAAGEPAAAPPPLAPAPAASEGLPMPVWVVGVIVLTILLLVVFGRG
jgi:carbon monoxide dehydrogenase subunit G